MVRFLVLFVALALSSLAVGNARPLPRRLKRTLATVSLDKCGCLCTANERYANVVNSMGCGFVNGELSVQEGSNCTAYQARIVQLYGADSLTDCTGEGFQFDDVTDPPTSSTPLPTVFVPTTSSPTASPTSFSGEIVDQCGCTCKTDDTSRDTYYSNEQSWGYWVCNYIHYEGLEYGSNCTQYENSVNDIYGEGSVYDCVASEDSEDGFQMGGGWGRRQ